MTKSVEMIVLFIDALELVASFGLRTRSVQGGPKSSIRGGYRISRGLNHSVGGFSRSGLENLLAFECSGLECSGLELFRYSQVFCFQVFRLISSCSE